MTGTNGGRELASGVVAGLAFVVVQLLARLIAGISSTVEVIQDQLVLLLPGPLFSFVLDRLLYLGKPLFFGGLLLAVVVVLSGLGVLAIRSREPLFVSAALWLLSGVVELLATGKGLFGGRSDIALSTMLSFGAYAAVLIWYGVTGTTTAARQGAPGEAISGSGFLGGLRVRRDLVIGGVLAVATLVLARLVIGSLPTLPSRGATAAPRGGAPLPTTSGETTGPSSPALPPHVTATADFYVVSKNIVDPDLDGSLWSLTVAGLVDHPASYTFDEFRALPSSQVERTLECISNEVGGDLMSNGVWKGVPLGELLSQAGAQAGAGIVHFACADGYTETMSLQKALDPATLLAYELNGAPLGPKHGFPVRVLGAGTYGMKNPKWVTRIDVAGTAEPGFWERQGWNPDAIVQTMARIDSPADGTRLSAGPVSIAGVAFAGNRGINRVELSSDGGASWMAATLIPPLSSTTWAFWQVSWLPKQPGTYTLIARAIDGTGAPQTAERAETFPVGATGYHQIRIDVSA